MGFRKTPAAIVGLLCLGAACAWYFVCCTGYTQLEITDRESGRVILSSLLRDGEKTVMTWRNSLFGLDVTEIFQSQGGFLVLDGVTFADPSGMPPPEVSPSDVDDLYQTGGPFTARGIGRSFSRVVYRVGEIGNPTFRARDRTVNFKNEVGFGGGVVLTAAVPSRTYVLRALLGIVPSPTGVGPANARQTSP
ncbi:MAG: hypothetical protein LLG06_18220 [Desulfobacteraceae bacterium]|nr:hypothetical protein [Desulfobacteraceae bacterium]